MKLITKQQERRLISNWGQNIECEERGEPLIDFKPVVKLVNPSNPMQFWLITELDPYGCGVFYGLFSNELGKCSIGPISVPKLKSAKVLYGLDIQRDTSFKSDLLLSQYAMMYGIMDQLGQ